MVGPKTGKFFLPGPSTVTQVTGKATKVKAKAKIKITTMETQTVARFIRNGSPKGPVMTLTCCWGKRWEQH
jgi:hypothetical protein